jgi:hypothetical protein
MRKSLLTILVTAASLSAADGWVGKWKMDAAKSEFVNTDLPAVKGMTLVISAEGGFHTLKFTIDTGKKIEHLTLKQPDQGGEVQLLESTLNEPVLKTMLEVPNDREWTYIYSDTKGKVLFTRSVKLSADGKRHDALMKATKDGKPVIEHEVVFRQ